MIRFPLELPKQTPKPKSWTKVLGQSLILLAIVLFFIYVFAPMLEVGMNG